MIRLTSIKDRAVEKLGAGSLVLFRHGGKWLPCLSVKHEGVAKLLALKFAPDPGSAPSPFLLQDNPAEPLEQRCLLLGPAEFYLSDLQSLAQSSTAYGRLVLDSHGAAITGRFSRKPDGMPQEHCWRISTDEAVQRIAIERTAPCAGAWEVGVMNDAKMFEKLLAFPYDDEEKTAS
jgi:hypothetical protein